MNRFVVEVVGARCTLVGLRTAIGAHLNRSFENRDSRNENLARMIGWLHAERIYSIIVVLRKVLGRV